LDSPRGRLWTRVVLCVCGVILAVGMFAKGKSAYAGMWFLIAATHGFMAVSSWNALKAGPGEQDEDPATP
jgi:hypothetical protein